MQRLAAELLAQARALHPDLDDQGLEALCTGAGTGEPLLPSQWYAERTTDASAVAGTVEAAT